MKMSASKFILAVLMAALLVNLALAQNSSLSLCNDSVYTDTSNDDAIRMSTPQLIARSGFKYEIHYVIADDGYITPIYRVINPKLNRTQLKGVVIMFHGANIDASCYFISSSIQHFPESYPSDGSQRSSNRSLGFALANDRWDVWVVGSRGSNKDAQRWTNNTAIRRAIRNGNYSVLNNNEELYDFAKTTQYWRYTQDDVINFDIRNQIDKVLNVTGRTQYNIYSNSLSTTTTLAFLALNPDYARRCKVYFQMAPAIAASHFSSFDALYFEKLCPLFPSRGAGFFPSFIIQPLLREFLIGVSVSPEVKATLVYALTTQIFGPSPLCQTKLERNVISHTFQPVSFKTVQQYCQNSVDLQFNKFNYTTKGNPSYYNSTRAPRYPIDYIETERYVIVHGTSDGLASPETVDRLSATVRAKNPVIRVTAQDFNHLDMISAGRVDIFVNNPVKAILNQFNPQ